MPIYDYRCIACAHRFEARQSFNDDPVAQCPACGENSERLITAVAVHFKGSGFYKTDYKSGNGRSSSNGNGKSDSADGKSESKGEATPSSSSVTADSKGSSKGSSTDSGGSSGSGGSGGSRGKEAATKSDK